eukprot:scaffold2254_cov393-Prasinococcus_capsulatus_cf.AAC.5
MGTCVRLESPGYGLVPCWAGSPGAEGRGLNKLNGVARRATLYSPGWRVSLGELNAHFGAVATADDAVAATAHVHVLALLNRGKLSLAHSAEIHRICTSSAPMSKRFRGCAGRQATLDPLGKSSTTPSNLCLKSTLTPCLHPAWSQQPTRIPSAFPSRLCNAPTPSSGFCAFGSCCSLDCAATERVGDGSPSLAAT